MNTAQILQLLGVVSSLAALLPDLIAKAQMAVKLIEDGKAPTAEQQAAIDVALDQAHAALQALAPKS